MKPSFARIADTNLLLIPSPNNELVAVLATPDPKLDIQHQIWDIIARCGTCKNTVISELSQALQQE